MSASLDIGKGFQNFVAGRLLGPFGQVLQSLVGGKSIYDKIADTGDFASNYIKGQTGSGLTQSQIEQNEWTASREDTQYQRGVQDLQAAGLNPAMMYGKGGQPAPSSPSASPSVGSMSDLLELAVLPVRLKQIEAQTEDLQASAAEKRSSVSLNEQLVEFNKDIQPLKIEAQKVANSIGRATEKKIYVEMDKMSVEMNKIAEEAETEEMKQLYYKAAADLDEAKAWQIIEMTPYSIELTKAQTSQARAIARLNFVQAAYQNKLLTEGFVDALIDSQVSGAEVSKVKARIKSGRAFQIDEPDKFIEKAWNAFAQASGISRGIQVIDYLLDKINLFAPLVSKGAGTAVGMSAAADPFGYLAGE